jgi:predicted transcriptional regulator
MNVVKRSVKSGTIPVSILMCLMMAKEAETCCAIKVLNRIKTETFKSVNI